MTDDSFKRPFPALTPAQRYHLDVYGYVVVENTLSERETGRLLEAMQRDMALWDRAPPIRLRPEQEETLRSLGYLGGTR